MNRIRTDHLNGTMAQWVKWKNLILRQPKNGTSLYVDRVLPRIFVKFEICTNPRKWTVWKRIWQKETWIIFGMPVPSEDDEACDNYLYVTATRNNRLRLLPGFKPDAICHYRLTEGDQRIFKLVFDDRIDALVMQHLASGKYVAEEGRTLILSSEDHYCIKIELK